MILIFKKKKGGGKFAPFATFYRNSFLQVPKCDNSAVISHYDKIQRDIVGRNGSHKDDEPSEGTQVCVMGNTQAYDAARGS